MNNRIMKRIIFFLCIALLSISCLWSCGEKSSEPGPVETVEAFYKALTAGQWAEAEALCDSVTMKQHIHTYKDACGQMQKSDSTVMAIAAGIMAGSEIDVTDSHKEDDKRVVTYTLKTGEFSKTRKATLRKEEGAWRVEKIADTN